MPRPGKIESKFGEEARQRAVEVHQRNAWKTEARGNQFIGGAKKQRSGEQTVVERSRLIDGVAVIAA